MLQYVRWPQRIMRDICVTRSHTSVKLYMGVFVGMHILLMISNVKFRSCILFHTEVGSVWTSGLRQNEDKLYQWGTGEYLLPDSPIWAIDHPILRKCVQMRNVNLYYLDYVRCERLRLAVCEYQ